MPFLFTRSAGRTAPDKTLTVDVYASLLDRGLLSSETKAYGFKTYIDHEPASPFLLDEDRYLEAWRPLWESALAEVAPSFGVSAAEALKDGHAQSSTASSSSPPSSSDGINTPLEELSLIDPAIVILPSGPGSDPATFTASITEALQQSAISRSFSPVKTMATRPSVQVNGLPSLAEDGGVDTFSPGGVERAERRRMMLSKLRPDAYPLRHEWVFWHERLDRSSCKSLKVTPTPSTAACKLDSVLGRSASGNVQSVTVHAVTGSTLQQFTASCLPLLDQSTGLTGLQASTAGLTNDTGRHDQDTTASGQAKAYEDILVPLMTVSTVKKFWETVNNFDLSTLKLRDSFHMFKKTVKPVWEDQRNVRGGSWTFRINKSISPAVWTNILLMAIGESLQGVVEAGDDICGVSISVRFNSHLVSVWNRDASNQQSIDAIKHRFLQELPEEMRPSPSNIYYKKHSEHSGFSEAIAASKAKIEISTTVE